MRTLKTFIRTAVLVATVSSLAAAASTAAAAPAADSRTTTVVFVHGAFADGSAWDKVIALLQSRGLHVVSVQNPLSSLADDVAATRRALDMQAGPVVLVGHSWGGAVISEVGQHERVKALVYVAAFAPSENQSVADLAKDYPKPAGSNVIVADKDGFLTLTPEGMSKHFAQDVPAAQTRIMAATQGPVSGKSFEDKVTVAAWRTRPSWYILSEQDHMIQPALQKAMAQKISARIVTLPTSHVPQLSRPKQVADAIYAAAVYQPKPDEHPPKPRR
ncbi:alpha/beta hydrolase [Cupriavidus necator]|uniref:Alpha/beta hydrolase n=1 Tax=Cupriavidus necator TaxID=106590 RepID=A0A367PQC7_CUPNE|nr:alpha/beta hydrolase [Cupriavidus necator]QQX86470.1 alpha/beta hydrolase [Cupriavidus necator]RCJ10110.1 alpha/beta hydrolase [Cupriavidus necator]